MDTSTPELKDSNIPETKKVPVYYQPRLSHIETAYRRDGRIFRVAVYEDGTTSDID